MTEPIHYFKFDEEGNTLIDSVSDTTGTLYNATRDIGWNGQGKSLKFNGSGYAQLNTKIPHGSKTINLKFKFTNEVDSQQSIISNYASGTTNGRGLRIWVNNKKLYVQWHLGSFENKLTFESEEDIVVNKWYDLWITWDGTLNNDLSIFLNKILIGALEPNQIETQEYNGIITLGRSGFQSSQYYYSMKGQIDELIIYDKEVSPYDALLKSNNKYYTYQNNEFIEVEPTVENFKENFVFLPQLITPNENGIKPYKLLDNPSIVTYIEDDEVPIVSQTVIASTKVRFLVSKDKINYQIYRNGEWITIDKDNILEQGMTKLELESIPQEAWAEWVENEAHKYSFDILIGIYSENPNTPLMRSITVNYAENESPIIINAYIEPDTIHNEFATLKAHVKDYEGDKISFKVLIKKAGTDEFVQVSPLEGWYNRNASETEITQAFNFPYFNPGENEVKLVVKDERGAEAEWLGRIILSNTDPIITLTYNDFVMKAAIGDDDGDDVAYRVDFIFAEYLKFGEENIIKLEVKDTHGGYASQEFTVIGTYRGLMFKNESGEYFVDNKGEVLMDLLFDKTLIGGQTSETKKVILENRHEFPLTNIKIEPENPNFVDGAVLEISETEMPFNPKSIIQILEIMPVLGEKDFYVRVRTNRSAHQGGYFYIKSTASPIVK